MIFNGGLSLSLQFFFFLQKARGGEMRVEHRTSQAQCVTSLIFANCLVMPLTNLFDFNSYVRVIKD